MVIGPDREAERLKGHGALMATVAKLTEDGERVPCLGAEGVHFTDDDAEVQNAAARLCRDCPALAACALYVTEHPEPAGAWAALTEHQRNRKPKKENQNA